MGARHAAAALSQGGSYLRSRHASQHSLSASQQKEDQEREKLKSMSCYFAQRSTTQHKTLNANDNFAFDSLPTLASRSMGRVEPPPGSQAICVGPWGTSGAWHWAEGGVATGQGRRGPPPSSLWSLFLSGYPNPSVLSVTGKSEHRVTCPLVPKRPTDGNPGSWGVSLWAQSWQPQPGAECQPNQAASLRPALTRR